MSEEEQIGMLDQVSTIIATYPNYWHLNRGYITSGTGGQVLTVNGGTPSWLALVDPASSDLRTEEYNFFNACTLTKE